MRKTNSAVRPGASFLAILILLAGPGSYPADVVDPPPVTGVPVVSDPVVPRVMPVDGRLADGFRWRTHPITGKKRFHRGIDIVAPRGSLVYAPATGVVTYAGSAGSYGILLELDHRSGYRTRFAHLDGIVVQPGQRVRFGEPVGRVGDSGMATGVHLHYEVIKEGRRINPWPYLRSDAPRVGGAAGR